MQANLDPQVAEVTILIGNVSTGDANADGVVNLSDHAVLAACMTGPCPSGGCKVPLYSSQNACGVLDADGDGDVDLKDEAVFQGEFDGS